jgi:hypothetical protein
MKEKAFVDSLFEGYEETAALADFKEELLGNLNAKIESLVKKGMDTEAAFAKASAELGDVSALANELSQKKRTEVFEEVYMDIRTYMPGRRVAGYVIFGVIAFFGIIVSLITLFAAKSADYYLGIPLNLTAFFSTIMPFLTVAAVGFTYLGVTQETSSLYPISKKRGAGYATEAGLISFGLFTMPIVFFSIRIADSFVHTFSLGSLEILVPVISMLIPFILPGVGVLVFLCLTEKDRQKPWAKDLYKKEMEIWSDPYTAGRFGMFSGAIWIFAVGLFFLLGFLIGFRFSWLVFLFGTSIQLVIQGSMFKQAKKDKAE